MPAAAVACISAESAANGAPAPVLCSAAHPGFLHDAGRRQLEQAHGTMQEITWRHSVYADETPRDVREIWRLFMRLAPDGTQALLEHFNTLRKVHRLAWSLSYGEEQQPAIVHSPFLRLAVDLVRIHYRDGMLIGLFDALLRNWQTLQPANRQTLSAFIAGKLKHCSDRRICLQNLKEHGRYYLRADGAGALAESLGTSRTGLSKVWQVLELPDHVRGYEYFADLAVAYTDLVVRREGLDDGIPDIIEFLGMHRQPAAVKKCLSRIVLAAEGSLAAGPRERVQAATLQLVGDPADQSRWRPWTAATAGEAADLQAARRRVNGWIVEWLLNHFFDNLLPDDGKKRFWLKYVDHIAALKIYCSERLHEQLSHSQPMRPYRRSHLGVIRGARGEEAVLVARVDNYLLLESAAAQPGFFACQVGSPFFPGLDARSIHLSDLQKLHDMEPLVQRKGENVLAHKQEGKIADGEVRALYLGWWLRHHLGV